GSRWEELRNSQEKRRTRLHSEKQTCPRRGTPTAVKTVLHRRQTERGGKVCWDAAQSDDHLPSCGTPSIARQSFLKRQPIMRLLRTRQRRRWERWNGRKTRFYPHLDALVS